MTIDTLIARLRPRRPAVRRPIDTATLSVRDWADLPTHHPRAD